MYTTDKIISPMYRGLVCACYPIRALAYIHSDPDPDLDDPEADEPDDDDLFLFCFRGGDADPLLLLDFLAAGLVLFDLLLLLASGLCEAFLGDPDSLLAGRFMGGEPLVGRFGDGDPLVGRLGDGDPLGFLLLLLDESDPEELPDPLLLDEEDRLFLPDLGGGDLVDRLRRGERDLLRGSCSLA